MIYGFQLKRAHIHLPSQAALPVLKSSISHACSSQLLVMPAWAEVTKSQPLRAELGQNSPPLRVTRDAQAEPTLKKGITKKSELLVLLLKALTLIR